MLAKLPEQQRKSRTSDLNNNVNTKLAGLTVVLIIMLGVTGGYILLPLLSSTQPADIATNLANNNTTTYTPASATPFQSTEIILQSLLRIKQQPQPIQILLKLTIPLQRLLKQIVQVNPITPE